MSLYDCVVVVMCGLDRSVFFFFLMRRRPPRSTRKESSAASDVYKRQELLDSKQKEFNTSIYLISDEPYREIIYDGAKVPCVLKSVSYTHLRAHETRHDLVCRLLLEKKKKALINIAETTRLIRK
ncbi:aspartate aminotransferase [Clostridioides difficile]|nr:aspartate aminotransferase [Clostridioides difficile]